MLGVTAPAAHQHCIDISNAHNVIYKAIKKKWFTHFFSGFMLIAGDYHCSYHIVVHHSVGFSGLLRIKYDVLHCFCAAALVLRSLRFEQRGLAGISPEK